MIYISPTRWIKTHNITTSSITLHRINNFNSQDFNHYPYLTRIYIAYIILTEIIITLNCYGLMAIWLTTYVLLCSYNNNITVKMAAEVAEICW
jgi:hypothetical protein